MNELLRVRGINERLLPVLMAHTAIGDSQEELRQKIKRWAQPLVVKQLLSSLFFIWSSFSVQSLSHFTVYMRDWMSLLASHNAMVFLSSSSTEIFGICVLVSDNDCDKQPSYQCCGEGTQWFRVTVKQPTLIPSDSINLVGHLWDT